MKIDEILSILDREIKKGMITKKGIANYLGISYSALMYKYKHHNFLYVEVEKLKELLR